MLTLDRHLWLVWTNRMALQVVVHFRSVSCKYEYLGFWPFSCTFDKRKNSLALLRASKSTLTCPEISSTQQSHSRLNPSSDRREIPIRKSSRARRSPTIVRFRHVVLFFNPWAPHRRKEKKSGLSKLCRVVMSGQSVHETYTVARQGLAVSRCIGGTSRV